MKNKMKILIGGVCLLLVLLIAWMRKEEAMIYLSWWNVALLSSAISLLLILIMGFFFWHYFEKSIEGLERLLEHHTNECPIRQERMVSACLQVPKVSPHTDSFRRYFQTVHPTFLIHLRELVSTVTPVEELLCMMIKMGLNNKEAADRMSISLASVHTVRYRLKRKLPLVEGVQMDEWIRNIE